MTILILLIASSVFAKDIVHLVYDIDHTCMAEVFPWETVNPDSVIEVNGVRYQILPWVRESITAHANNPRIRVSFFSGGTEIRNIAALKKIKLTDGSGRSFFDIAFKIKSHKHLTDKGVPISKGTRFTDRFKKDIRLFTEDLDNVIIIDDHLDFYHDARFKRNVLWLGQWYYKFKDYEDTFRSFPKSVPIHEFPPSQEKWWLSQNKMAIVHQMIIQAMDNRDHSLVDAMAFEIENANLGSGVPNNYVQRCFKIASHSLSSSKGRAHLCLDGLNIVLGVAI